MSKFTFRNRTYEYFDHKGNATRTNERRMELPIAFEFVGRHQEVLEIGNVTRHYHREFSHDVVDLYEKSKWPIWNKDVLTFTPDKTYDATLSVSTVEHTVNALEAIKRITIFAPIYLVTTPFGYETTKDVPNLDLPIYYMKRVNLDENHWVQTTKEDVLGTKYGTPYPFANAVMIITNEKL